MAYADVRGDIIIGHDPDYQFGIQVDELDDKYTPKIQFVFRWVKLPKGNFSALFQAAIRIVEHHLKASSFDAADKLIVETDNFGSDYPCEEFVNLPAMTQARCDMICEIVNGGAGKHSHRYWKVVDKGYKLQPGFEG